MPHSPIEDAGNPVAMNVALGQCLVAPRLIISQNIRFHFQISESLGDHIPEADELAVIDHGIVAAAARPISKCDKVCGDPLPKELGNGYAARSYDRGVWCGRPEGEAGRWRTRS
jgi:hypothetical protein